MDITVLDIALVPVIIGLVEVFKTLGLTDRYAALASLLLGVVAGVVFADTGILAQDVLVGIALGLSASGLYSGSKSLVE